MNVFKFLIGTIKAVLSTIALGLMAMVLFAIMGLILFVSALF